jgi:hypothetical protein
MKLLLGILLLALSFNSFAGYNLEKVNHKVIKVEIGGTGSGAADVVAVTSSDASLMTIPAKTVILRVMAYVSTALLPTGGTMTIGDADDEDGFLKDGFSDSTGMYPYQTNVLASTYAGVYQGVTYLGDTGPKYYASAGTLKLYSNTTLTAGEGQVHVDFIQLE